MKGERRDIVLRVHTVTLVARTGIRHCCQGTR
jgi:hypothetical protein